LQALHEDHYNMSLTCNVTDLNFDGESTTSPIGEARGISLLAFSAHEVKPIWPELITPIVLCLLLITLWNLMTQS